MSKAESVESIRPPTSQNLPSAAGVRSCVDGISNRSRGRYIAEGRVTRPLPNRPDRPGKCQASAATVAGSAMKEGKTDTRPTAREATDPRPRGERHRVSWARLAGGEQARSALRQCALGQKFRVIVFCRRFRRQKPSAFAGRRSRLGRRPLASGMHQGQDPDGIGPHLIDQPIALVQDQLTGARDLSCPS